MITKTIDLPGTHNGQDWAERDWAAKINPNPEADIELIAKAAFDMWFKSCWKVSWKVSNGDEWDGLNSHRKQVWIRIVKLVCELEKVRVNGYTPNRFKSAVQDSYYVSY